MITLMSPSVRANVGNKTDNVKANNPNFGQVKFGLVKNVAEETLTRKTIFDDLINKCGEEGKKVIDDIIKLAKKQKDNNHADIHIYQQKNAAGKFEALGVKVTKDLEKEDSISEDKIPLYGFSRFDKMGTPGTLVSFPDADFVLKDADEKASLVKERAILRQAAEDDWQNI